MIKVIFQIIIKKSDIPEEVLMKPVSHSEIKSLVSTSFLF